MEALGQGVDTCKRQPLSRQHTMKIIVSMDARGWAVYEGTMELSSRYTPHKQLLKRQTAISESFKHCR